MDANTTIAIFGDRLKETKRKILTALEFEQIRNELQSQLQSKIGIESSLLLKELELRDIAKQIELKFPSRIEKRIIVDKPHVLEIAASIRKNGYFSHQTAAHILGLESKLAHNIYYNYPQAGEIYEPNLTQASIDKAFMNSPRLSKTFAEYQNWKLFSLNSKGRRGLGITSTQYKTIGEVAHTTVSKTLIDLAVRPAYCGGPQNVLRLYKAAKTAEVEPDEILDMLYELSYVYPVQQAIGFYLERSEIMSGKKLDRIQKGISEFNFYLDYKIQNPKFDKKWRIYYPAELD